MALFCFRTLRVQGVLAFRQLQKSWFQSIQQLLHIRYKPGVGL